MELDQIQEALKDHDLELIIGLETHVRLIILFLSE
jgi:hypothetical protein